MGAACGAGVAGESDAVACERAVDIFCAETMPKAARPMIIKAATMLITKRIIRLLQCTKRQTCRH